MRTDTIGTASLAFTVLAMSLPAAAEVVHETTNPMEHMTYVYDDPWQPDGFVTGQRVPATWLPAPDVEIDGACQSVPRTLVHGDFVSKNIRVRWEDATEDREHHPWVWDDAEGRYVASPQIEDSVMLSFEAGCEWTPSLLGGYTYDFDGWQWMAARSDPLGQALDLYGNVRARDPGGPTFFGYKSRVVEKDWVLKFTNNTDPDLYADWDQLDRVYMLLPVNQDLWISAVPDGGNQSPPFAEQLPAPAAAPDDTSQVFPQYSPVRLTGSAAQVAAKGHWEDGYWTVEFRRVQFSVQVFEDTERLDETSESDRLYLQFLRPERKLAKN